MHRRSRSIASRVVVELVAAGRAASSRGERAQAEAAVVLVRRRDERERLAGAAVRSGRRRPRRRAGSRAASGSPRSPSGESAIVPGPAVAADGAAGRRLIADEPLDRAALDAAVEVRHVARRARAASAGRRARADRAPGVAGARDGISSSRSRKRVSAVNARSFASCSGKSRSIASAPIRPTASR